MAPVSSREANLGTFDGYNFTNEKIRKNIYRNYRFLKKPVQLAKGRIPTDTQVRKSDKLVSYDPEKFHFDDDITVTGVGEVIKAKGFFEELTYLEQILKTNLRKLGFEQLTHVQQVIIPMITGSCYKIQRNTVLCGRTGSGKTLGYLIAAVNHVMIAKKTLQRRDVIIEPKISVLILIQSNAAAEQVYTWVKKLAGDHIEIATAIGHFNRTEEAELHDRMGGHILIATIGRLTDYLSNNPDLIKGVSLLIIDDAEVFMRDENWYTAISIIHEAIESRNYQRILLSAGFDERTFKTFSQFVGDDFWFIDIASLNKVEKTIPQKFIELHSLNRTEETKKILLDHSKDNRYPKAIVFCNSKEVATMLANRLRLDHSLPKSFRPRVAFLHGGTYDAQSIFDAFRTEKGMRTDLLGDDSVEIDVIVACDGYAYGIEAKVELVINFDYPNSLCIYAQRIGRVGRQGVKGEAITLLNTGTMLQLPKRVTDTIDNVLYAAAEAKAEIPDSMKWRIERSRSSYY